MHTAESFREAFNYLTGTLGMAADDAAFTMALAAVYGTVACEADWPITDVRQKGTGPAVTGAYVIELR